MTPTNVRRLAILATALALPALSALADTRDVNIAGWQAVGEFAAAGNSQAFITLPAGATVTGFDYLNLRYTTAGDSWQSELVLSLSNQPGSAWLDWRPSTTEAPGSFGPSSGSWGGPTGVDGPFGSSGPFATPTGSVWLSVYLSFSLPPVGVQIEQGNLRIQYDLAPVPEPASDALMTLGLLGMLAVATRRRA